MIKKEVLFLLSFMFSYLSLCSQMDSIAYYKEQVTNIKKSPSFTPNDTTYVAFLNTLSAKYKYINSDTLGILSQEALEISKRINYKKGEIVALSHLAIFELLQGKFKQSIDYNELALQSVNIKNSPELAANIYNVMGQAFFSLDDHPEAYKYFRKSLLLAKKTNNKDLVVKINSNLGTLFYLIEDYDEALEHYELALSAMDEKASSVTKSGVQCNLGYLYMKKNDSTKALEFLNKGLPGLIEAKVTVIIPVVYMAYGDVYLNNNNYNKALSYFEKANSYYLSSNDIVNKAYSLYSLGLVHLKLNNLIKSENYLIESLDLYKNVNFKEGLKYVYKSLYKVNSITASDEKALHYLELSQSYSDSIFKEKSIRDISMFKAKMQFEEDKATITNRNDMEVAEQKKYVQRAILGLICALIIALLVFQANRTEKKLNKELAIQTHNLTQKQEELNTINKNQDKLFSIVGHDLRGPIVSLKQLLTLALENETGVQHFYRFGPKLKKDVDHIHFTLDNLLNWGLTQMHGEPLNPIKVNIQKEISEIIVLFREILDKKSITIHKDFFDSGTIFVDANHFKIIFRNLISNAIKFTPEYGEIWLKSEIKENNIVISIQDNGIGMTKDVLNRVFNQSEYYTTFGTDNERGTGLGLALCKEMVIKNNGSISGASIPNEGSTFYVKFPKSNQG
jgi:signal transduction histidine kinase